MAYNKKTWVSDEIITDAALNNIENGIAALDENQKNFLTEHQDLSNYAKKNQGIFYIVGNSTGTEGEWTGTHPDITEYYEGMIIAYQKLIEGGANGTYININNLGRVPVYKNRLTTMANDYLIGCTLFLVYNVYDGKYAFRIADLDTTTNTKNTFGNSELDDTKLYLGGVKTVGTSSSSSATSYVNSNVYIGTDNCLYSNGEKVVTVGENSKTAYGTCSTAASTAEKAVVVDDTNWKLEVGCIVAVKFSATNKASNVTINVNGTGAYPIWAAAEEYTGTSSSYAGYKNRICIYMFNGTHWAWISCGVYPSSTTNASLGHGYAVCDTAEATLEKACTISSYTLSTGGSVSIKFTNAVPADSTLNIRTRGAKNIFYKGAAITDGIIKAGDTATFVYDGTQYQLISIDADYATKDYVGNVVSDAIDDCVKTVNGIAPNTEGNVVIDCTTKEYVDNAVDNCVKTVNGVAPNAEGNVVVTATLEAPEVVDSIEEMTDTNKQYILKSDGFIYAYKLVNNVIEETWNDELDDIGYQKDKRVNSSGEVVSYTVNPTDATNYIPCKPGDVVKLKGFSIPSTYVNGTYYQTLALYREDKTWIGSHHLCTSIVANNTGLSLVEENGYTVGFTLNEVFVGSEVAYMIITSQNIDDNSEVLIKGLKPSVPNFTNVANTDGTDWMMDQRISTTSIAEAEGLCITNAFNAKNGDTVYFKNLDIYQKLSSSMRFGMWSNGIRVNTIEGTSPYYGEINGQVILHEDGVVSCKLVNQNTGEDFETEFDTVRFSVASGTNFSKVIITVNEEITYSFPPESEYKWANTGIAYSSVDYGEDIAQIKEDINNLEETVSNLKNTTGNNVLIPGYWIGELDTKVDTIQQIIETTGRNKSVFFWYTDAHWQLNAKKLPLVLDYLIRNTPINKVNCGGDIVGDPSPYDHENIKFFYDWRKAMADIPNHHSVYGNHDLNHWTTDVHNISYSLILAHEETNDMVVSDIDGCYYIDCPSEKTRYLYLSYLTKSQSDMMAQGQFIVDSIKDVKEGWHIVAIAHRWFQYTSSKEPTVGSVPPYESEILDIFDKYNSRTSRSSSNYFYEQDFTNCKGKVEFCIGGHIHVDYDFASPGGIPVIITAADTNQERAAGEDEDCGVVGTITEQAVFAIIADYANSKINVVGIGRGGSREITLN